LATRPAVGSARRAVKSGPGRRL